MCPASQPVPRQNECRAGVRTGFGSLTWVSGAISTLCISFAFKMVYYILILGYGKKLQFDVYLYGMVVRKYRIERLIGPGDQNFQHWGF